MRRRYDCIIVGSGVAGNICAYELQRKGYSCLIIEKTCSRLEKICGGGIPYKALERLEKIGMNLDDLFQKDVVRINGDVIISNEKIEETLYKKPALGCRRADFDDFLLKEALNIGAEICWGMPVRNIEEFGNGYRINDYYADNIVIAAGARGIFNRYYQGQSVGISAQITGRSTLKPDQFTYYYLTNTGDRYFWMFPVGKEIWNIGLWYRIPDQTMKKTFAECWNKYINRAFSSYIFLHKPQAEFCGNIKINEGFKCDAIGDYSGTNNIKNGGGIYRAIKSALEYTNGVGKFNKD